MAADRRPAELPEDEVDLAEVMRRFPTLRQSALATYDACPRTSLFDMQMSFGWSGPEAARGTLFHLFAAEYLRTLVRTGEQKMPVAEALEVFYDVAKQDNVPPHERVHVPRREWKNLRLSVIKFAKDNVFSIDKIVGIEERLGADITYDSWEDNSTVVRRLTGQLDVLIFMPPDGALILDWKSGWGLPPKPRAQEPDEWETAEDEVMRRLSVEGYFQQRFYGWLVMMTYPAVQRVTLREHYVFRGQNRQATLTRADLEHVERELSDLVRAFDRDIARGAKAYGKGVGGDPFPAQPGSHCVWCKLPDACPIGPDARKVGAVTDEERASRYAAEYMVAKAVAENRNQALRPWCREHGPVEIKSSKGRKVIGFNVKEDGRQVFEVFTPDSSDQGPADPAQEDGRLVDALLASAMSAEDERKRRKAILEEAP